MKHILDALRDFVPAAQSNPLQDADFYLYLEKNPVLYSLMSAALREGDVTDGNIMVNHPACFDPKLGKASVTELVGDMVDKLRYFSRWLATASKKHGFTILGGKLSEVVQPKKVKTSKAKKTPVPKTVVDAPYAVPAFGPIPKRQKLLAKFCKKVGDADLARAVVASAYKEQGGQEKAALYLSKKYNMRISQNLMGRWMIAFRLPVKPRVGGRQLVLKEANRKADQVLRKRHSIGLVAFLRDGRVVRGKKWSELALEVKKLTKISVAPYSLTRVAARAHIR